MYKKIQTSPRSQHAHLLRPRLKKTGLNEFGTKFLEIRITGWNRTSTGERTVTVTVARSEIHGGEKTASLRLVPPRSRMVSFSGKFPRCTLEKTAHTVQVADATATYFDAAASVKGRTRPLVSAIIKCVAVASGLYAVGTAFFRRGRRRCARLWAWTRFYVL